MKSLRLISLALLPFATLAAAPPAKRPAAHADPAARDWSRIAGRTAEGNYRLGNPAAKVKLVEFLSFTCPHCAAFEADAVPKLIDRYVRAGRVSYEVRVALRDPFDLAAATLARCDGPAPFFQRAPILFAAQERWGAQAETWSRTAPDLSKMNEGDAGRAVMRGAGLDAVLAGHGMAASRAAQCVGNVAEQKFLAAQARTIWAMPGFPGTPAFLVDGTLNTAIHDWAALDAALAAALR